MSDLLNMLRHGGAPSVESSAAREQKLVVKTPTNSSGVLRVPVCAQFGGLRTGDQVSFITKNAGQGAMPQVTVGSVMPGIGRFLGTLDITAPTSDSPIRCSIQVGAQLNPQANGLSDATCAPEAGLAVDVQELDRSCDQDGNGIPDVLASINPGEMWFATVELPGVHAEGRCVNVANLDNDANRPIVSLVPAEGLRIDCPSLDSLMVSGVLPEEADCSAITALALVSTAPALLDLADTVRGDTTLDGRALWAANTQDGLDAHPWPLLDGRNLFIAINLVYTLDGGATYNSIPDLARNPAGDLIPNAPGIELVWNGPTASGEAVYVSPLDIESNPSGCVYAAPWENTTEPSTPNRPETDAAGTTRVRVTTPGALLWASAPAEPTITIPQPEAPIPSSDAKPSDEPLVVNGIEPSRAWLFGGVIATVTGSGFTDGMEVSFGGRKAAFVSVINAQTAKVLVPASPDRGVAATIAAPVSAQYGALTADAPMPFTYLRHECNERGTLFTTAFILDDPQRPAPGIAVPLTVVPASTCAYLDLPPVLQERDVAVYGLARFAIATSNDGGKSPLHTDQMREWTPESGQPAAGAWDFSVHLYRPDTVSTDDLSELAAGYDVLNEFSPNSSSSLRSASTAMRVSFPLDSGSLAYDDLANGLYSIWAFTSHLDCVSGQDVPASPFGATYQSQILANEVAPVYTEESADLPAEGPRMVLRARLYDGNTFSLRRDAMLPAAAAERIRLGTEAGTAEGPAKGGQGLTIISPMGGLGWCNSVTFQPSGGADAPPLKAKVLASTPGVDEYLLQISTPEAPKTGAYDLIVQLKSGANPVSITLGDVYQYKAIATPDWVGPVAVVAGLAVALVGIASGGKSGGGGGGPCFIATAAYGTPMAAEIDVLRDVRDVYLLESGVGTAFVDAYYQVSPPVAAYIAAHPVLSTAVRCVLTPVVWISKASLAAPIPMTLLMVFLLGIGLRHIHRRSLLQKN